MNAQTCSFLPRSLVRWNPIQMLVVLAICGSTAGGRAQETGGLPPRKVAPAGNVIRTWGDDAMRGVMTAWERAFASRHPEIRFEDKLFGSGSGMAGIITGVAQLAVMGRAATANEVMGFEWVYRYKPRGFEVLTGSIATRGESPALAVFVHRDNPVERLTVQQLAQILECCNARTRITLWRQLGVVGSLAHSEIHVYTYNCETGTGAFLQKSILGSSDKWDWQRVREFGELRLPRSADNTGREIMSAFERDPNGIAISTMGYVTRNAKAVALAAKPAGEYFLPDKERVQSREYPLSRSIYIYVNAPPDAPLDPTVAEFLRFVLSSEGQRIAGLAGSYLPLPAPMAMRELRELTQ